MPTNETSGGPALTRAEATTAPATSVGQATDKPMVRNTSSNASAPSTVSEPPRHPSWPIKTHVVAKVREHLATLKTDATREDVLKAIDALEHLTDHEKSKFSRQLVEMNVKNPTLDQMRDALGT